MTHLPYDGQVILAGFGQLAKELPAYSLPRRPLLAETVADLAVILRMCEPAVSVVMPMYNGSRYVADGVRSILAQTIGRFEIIGVDDASPDDSRAVLEALRTEIQDAGHTLRVVRLDTNQGPGGARNAGLEVATDDYIAFLDQDDLWPRERTAVLWAALKASGALVAQGRMSFEDVGSPSERRWVRQRWFDHDDHPGHALGALLCRREALPEVGVLNPAFSAGVDDIDWLMRARSAGIPWLSVPQVSLIRRIHDTNFSRRSSHTQLLAVVRTHYQRQHVEDC
jgi:glycosyltransferase involved in cell wall biosynthesis